jgi:hypothetical protein
MFLIMERKKKMIRKKILLGLLMFSGGSFAADSDRFTNPIKNKTVCKGTHVCQSQDSLGHECTVSGSYLDPNRAFFVLKADDCCGHTAHGGKTIQFKWSGCGPL